MLLHAVVRLLRRPTSTEGHFGADEVARVNLQLEGAKNKLQKDKKSAHSYTNNSSRGSRGAKHP
jgi:hypothetical protein